MLPEICCSALPSAAGRAPGRVAEPRSLLTTDDRIARSPAPSRRPLWRPHDGAREMRASGELRDWPPLATPDLRSYRREYVSNSRGLAVCVSVEERIKLRTASSRESREDGTIWGILCETYIEIASIQLVEVNPDDPYAPLSAPSLKPRPEPSSVASAEILVLMRTQPQARLTRQALPKSRRREGS
jgi:hypothetical protein